MLIPTGKREDDSPLSEVNFSRALERGGRRGPERVGDARAIQVSDAHLRSTQTSSGKQEEEETKKSAWEEINDFKQVFVEAIANLCGQWAGYVFDHPYRVSIFAFIVAAGAVIGFIPGIAVWLDGAENLYALPHTQAKNDGLLHNSIFHDALALPNFVLITSDPPGDNIFTWEHLSAAHQIDQLVRGKVVDPVGGRRLALPALPAYLPGVSAASLSRANRAAAHNTTVSRYDADPRSGPVDTRSSLFGYAQETFETRRNEGAVDVMTYEDICARNPFGTCQVTSVFEMGIWDMKKILPKNAPPELYILGGNIFNAEKKGFVPDYVLGGLETKPCERELPTNLLTNFFSPNQLKPGSSATRSLAKMDCVTSVKAFHMIYEVDDRKEFQARNYAWMEMMYTLLSENRHFHGLLVAGNAFKSRDDELRRSTSESQDIIFVIFTFIIIISYTAAINFSCDLYKNRAVTALFGSLATLLGILCGFGYTSLMGVAFVPTALVTPFLVMGVGCDDVFVLINSYALAYCEPTPRDRCIVTFKDCGVSVILTTATNLIAFGVGCQSPYISIRNFCLFSLNGLAFSLFFELTIFLAALCLDAQRETDRRSCFCGGDDEPDAEEVTETKRVASVVSNLFGDRRLSTFELVNYQVSNDWSHRKGFEPCMKSSMARKRKGRPFILKRLKKRFVDRGNQLFEPAHADPIYKTLTTTEDDGYMHTEARLKTETVNSGAGHNLSVVTRGRRSTPTRQQTLTSLLIASNHPAFTREPPGNVGRHWRIFFSNVYCVKLLHPAVKVIVMLVFAAIFALAVRGITLVESGLELKDLSPDQSYLRVYDALYSMYFWNYDIPVYVFFPEPTPWWDPRVIRTLRVLDEKLRTRSNTRFLNDPLMRMVDDKDLAPALNSGDRSMFETSLYDSLRTVGSKYKQFEKDFVWEGHRLIGWKITLLPAGMSTSQERADWMRSIRDDVASIVPMGYSHSTVPSKDLGVQLKSLSGTYYPLKAIAWNYMMVFYESDLHITTSVISSMTTAMISMLVVALILIPEIVSGLLVIFVMSLIDIAVMGFMYYWDVKLHMISMITLVISIGFSIDYSAHICHTFTHCLGRTRNLRAVECVVLMGTPVFHGAASTIAGILILGNSQSFIFRLFFKMLTLTLTFGIAHGLILLPVLLSLMGKMPGDQIVEQSPPALLAMDVERLRTDLTTHESKVSSDLVPWSPPIRTNPPPEELAQIWESPKASEISGQPEPLSPVELPPTYKPRRHSSVEPAVSRRSTAARHDVSVTKRRDIRDDVSSGQQDLRPWRRDFPERRRHLLQQEALSRRDELQMAHRQCDREEDDRMPDRASHLSEPRPRRSASLASSSVEPDARWIDSYMSEQRANPLPPDLLARVRRTSSRQPLLQPTATHTRHRSSTNNDTTGQATEYSSVESPACRLNRFVRTLPSVSPELLSPTCRPSPTPSPCARPCSATSFVSAIATARELQRDETRISFLSGPQSMPLVASPSPLIDVAAPLRHKERRAPEDLATAVLSSLQLAREIEGRWGRSPVRNSAPATPWRGRSIPASSSALIGPAAAVHRRRHFGSSPQGLANPVTPRLLPFQDKPTPAPPDW